MNIISFFGDAKNATFICIFLEEDYLCFYWQKDNTIFVTFIHIYRKYNLSMYFLRKAIFHFPSKEKVLYFRENRSTIVSDITKKITFQCDFLGKTIFSKHLKKSSYFHAFFEKDCLFFSI